MSVVGAEVFSVRNESSAESRRREVWLLAAIACAFGAAHFLTDNQYGLHRDELQFLADARHLDWGFVAYPPFTPLVERASTALFGMWLPGLRLFSVIAQAVAILLGGLMARDLGGGRWAQVTAALTVALSPLPIFQATEFQYSSFDLLWWVLAAWMVIRLLRSDNPRWWIGVGAVLGVGLQTKYSIAFYIAGIVGGLVLSRTRRHVASVWFWAGFGIALLIFLPNLIWLARHNFISYHFLQHIHQRDVGNGRADGFLTGQLWLCVNAAAVPLCVAGLVAYFRNARFRMLGWMYVITLALFWAGKGRFYYVAPLYPMLLAQGSVTCERWLAGLRPLFRRTVSAILYVAVFALGVYICAILVPIASSGPLRAFALSRNGDLREQIGWDELVRTVAGIRNSLPPDQRAQLGILVGNYGEGGAIEILGPQYQLPAPISMTNSAWLRGYPTPTPSTLIVIGFSQHDADANFTGCRWAGHNGNSQGVQNEESKYHPDIFVCGPPRLPWPEFWKRNQRFG